MTSPPTKTPSITPQNSPLGERIARLIAGTEPINIAQFMQLCLLDPQFGYYTTQNPIGKEGDFITAPETSQMFGELIGIWAMQTFENLNKPERFNLVELGPGRGLLMADLLRAAKTMPGFIKQVEIHLIEASPTLRKIQEEQLSEFRSQIFWHENIEDIPAAPTILIANEFFDALPFRQYIAQDGHWLERLVGVDEAGGLQFCLGPGSLDTDRLPPDHETQENGAVLEIAPAREATVSTIATHIHRHGGAVLIIDYGHDKTGFGDTFQAIRDHQYVNILDCPGRSDLTSHVDFEALAKAVSTALPNNNLKIDNLKTQCDFLLEMGLLERAGALGSGKSQEIQERITREVERLAGPEQMGNLFKVFSFSSQP